MIARGGAESPAGFGPSFGLRRCRFLFCLIAGGERRRAAARRRTYGVGFVRPRWRQHGQLPRQPSILRFPRARRRILF